MDQEQNAVPVVPLLLLVIAAMMSYFVYAVHQVLQRQSRLERYLVTSARILSVCAGGVALPPILQQVGKLFSHAERYEDSPEAEWWAYLHRMSQQRQGDPHHPHQSSQAFYRGAATQTPGGRRRAWEGE